MYFVWLIYMLYKKSQTTSVSFWVSELFSREYAWRNPKLVVPTMREAKEQQVFVLSVPAEEKEKKLQGALLSVCDL